MRLREIVVLSTIALAAGTAAAADVKLDNAWMRPAYAGQAQAMVYVDIRASEPLRLVAARSPAAKRAELVVVDPPGAPPDQHRVVPELPVSGSGVTRLAYLGSHVRLLDVGEDLYAGRSLVLELEFVDARGKRHRASTEAVVRGIAARRPEEASGPSPKP
jgi:copper(I)-binding protein